MSILETRAILALLRSAPGPFALATLVEVEGSSYRRTGARFILANNGRSAGSISGGCLEDDVRLRAKEVLTTGVAQVAVYDTTSENDLVWGVGLGCHGIVRVFIERLAVTPVWATALASNLDARAQTELEVVWAGAAADRLGTRLARDAALLPPGARVYRQTAAAPVRLVVCGAGDDAVPLVRFAHGLGWHVTVGDPRPAFATAARFPDADTVIAAPPEEIARRVPGEDPTVAIVMTHHYVHDVPLVRDLLPRSLAFLGLLGPKRRAEKILADLAAGGLKPTPAQLARFHAPVGLDLGADNPEEVALSIVAEIRSVLAGRDGRPLRERKLPIHG
jgi:xanthine dehydrogenase accessory factor